MSRVWRGRVEVELFVIVTGDRKPPGPGSYDAAGLLRDVLSEHLDLSQRVGGDDEGELVQMELYVGETEVRAEMEELTPDAKA